MTSVSDGMCACGYPLHYVSKDLQRHVQALVDRLGPDVRVAVPGEGVWLVPRHYIALHGLRAADLPLSDFPKVE